MSRFTVDPPEPVRPARRILSRVLQWLSLASAAFMVAGYFGLFGDDLLPRRPEEIRWFRRRGRIAEVTRYVAGSRRTDHVQRQDTGKPLGSRRARRPRDGIAPASA